ncbi:hypothetical protein [Frateuria sp. STR12]|uniref:hypothetical protein n=1 Tax=Frateuria hangzhouensis TaxID=2995589 RepID=UPI002260C912|nr:hypothetical protein [Frateuria sp. STR12]MCX7513049.1 hypothetical protein [Frateuria sp. STR12]
MRLARRIVAASLLVPALAAFASQGSRTPAQPLQIGTTGVATVTPGLPVPAGAPCVVNLFQNLGVAEMSPSSYVYAPPSGCLGPWSKVILQVGVTESPDGSYEDATNAYIRLGNIPLFEGGLAMARQPTPASWQVERDVTDLAPLLIRAHKGQAGLVPEQTYWYNEMSVDATLSARLLFYPASSRTPASKTPDSVYPVTRNSLITLPHNIVRAYLDVYNARPWWFTCASDQEAYNSELPFFSSLAPGGAQQLGIFAPGQGCAGSSFEEILVRVDGVAAGIAPVFPALSADLNNYFPRTLNAPVQPPQMLNHVPYRVDLTPFAPYLNRTGKHRIELSLPANAYLLVYLDKGSTMVNGFVTVNTLNGERTLPLINDTVRKNGDSGTVRASTRLDHDFDIEGYMMTSRGRVDTSVHQISHFLNTQVFYFDGLQFPEYRHYQEHLWLASQTQQHSRRTRAGVVLQDDVVTASYPLQWFYDMDGYVFVSDEPEAVPSKGSISVEQHRNLDASYLKGGFGTYTSRVRDNFVSSHTRDLRVNQDRSWKSQAAYRFGDSQGSCYQSALTALNGAVSTEAQGVGCTDGQNRLRWHDHPDGSPDSLGWVH